MSRTTWVSRYQKGKTRKVKANLDLLDLDLLFDVSVLKCDNVSF